MSRTLRIVMVCSGNICRSPMAVVIAEELLRDAQIPHMIISGGTLNIHGRAAAPLAQRAVAELGLDLSSHRSQGAQPGLMRLADYIVVMAPRHEAHLLRADPSLRPKIVRLWEYDPEDEGLDQIPDPVGHDEEVFRANRDMIKRCLEAWVDTLPRDDS